MRTLSYTELPRTNDPRQVFTVDVTVDSAALHARVELRYLSAPDQWVISIWDNASSVLLSSVTATQNETSPDGWSGELVFTECLSESAEKETKADDNASKATHTGSAAPPNGISGEVQRAADEAAAAAAADVPFAGDDE